MTHPVTAYARSVLSGKSPAGQLVKLACRRHLHDLELAADGDDSFPFVFDGAAAMRPVRFIGLLKQWEGEFSGQPLVLGPWQVFIVGSLFGWRHRETGLRRFRTAYVEVPRKNGKSTLVSGVSLYMLAADGEEGAQIYSLATKRDQAKIVWNSAAKIVKKSGLDDAIAQYWVGLKHTASNSMFEPLAADGSKLDGLNPHGTFCDELHEWPDRGLWDVMEDAMGARRQPLMFAITTAGYDRHGICYQQRGYGVSVLEAYQTRGFVDDAFFSYIATVDPEDAEAIAKGDPRWQDPKVWAKANPNLGVSKKLDYMADQANKAELMNAKLNTFLNKQLNIWTEVKTAWLKMDRWDACSGEVDPDALTGQPCYAAWDLSSTGDITALVLCFPPHGEREEYAFLHRYYLPEDNLRDRCQRDRVPYDQWARDGLLTLTPGDVVDYDFLYTDLVQFAARYQILEIGFDPWHALELAQRVQKEGLAPLVQMRQGHQTMAGPTKEFEKLVITRKLRHGGHPIQRWMAANTTVLADSNGNIRPVKSDATGKVRHRIDGIVAAIMALGRALAGGGDGPSVYEARGLRDL